MNKELLVNERHEPQLYTYQEDELNQDQLRVQVEYGSPKHGTELNVFKNQPFAMNYYDEEEHIFKKSEQTQSVRKQGLGNICVGKISEIGAKVDDVKVGERVAVYGHLRNTHTVKAENIIRLPSDMTWQTAVCFDPMQFALGGLRDANLRIGDRVLISGLGAIGQMAAQAAKLAGASFVAVSDPIDKRREVALANGADIAFNPINEDYGLLLRDMTAKQGVDVVIETSGNYRAIEQGLRALGYMGNMALVGWFKDCTVPLNLGREGHFNNQNIFFSRACSEPNRDQPRWNFQRLCDAAWQILATGKIKCDNIIEPVVSFTESDQAYIENIVDHPERSIKMGVRF